MNPENLMQALEDATAFTAWLTGVKNDLVKRGWNENNAEHLVIAMVCSGGAK